MVEYVLQLYFIAAGIFTIANADDNQQSVYSAFKNADNFMGLHAFNGWLVGILIIAFFAIFVRGAASEENHWTQRPPAGVVHRPVCPGPHRSRGVVGSPRNQRACADWADRLPDRPQLGFWPAGCSSDRIQARALANAAIDD